MNKRCCPDDDTFSHKKVRWSYDIIDEEEVDIFEGKFKALYIEKKNKKQLLYEKELNRYKKDRDTTENLFAYMTTFVPMDCVKQIKDFSDTTKIYKEQYITRCDKTYLKFEDCKCHNCEEERENHIDFQMMIEEERMDHAMDVYYDW
jgi:hypothetical protein